MTVPQDQLERTARTAGAAVRAHAAVTAAQLGDLGGLRRRLRRRLAARAVASVAGLALLAVPAVLAVLDDSSRVDFADTPPGEALQWERMERTGEVFGQPGAADGMSGVAVLGDRIVAVGTASANSVEGRVRPGVWLSEDGRAWRAVPGDRIGDDDLDEAALLMQDVTALDDGRLVAVGYINWEPATEPAVWTSEDAGESWALHRDVDLRDVDNGELFAVTVAPDGALVAVGRRHGNDLTQSAPTTWRSEDGLTWEMIDAGSSDLGAWGLVAVAASQDRLVAVGSSSEGAALVQHSEDGQSWQVAPTVGSVGQVHLSDVLAVGDTFVAVGSTPADGGRAYVSKNGGWAWEELPGRSQLARPGTQDLGAVGLAEDGRVVVAGSDRGHAAVWVRDGTVWQRVPADEHLWPTGGVAALAVSPHGLVAVGFTADAGGSEDAAVWLSPTPEERTDLTGEEWEVMAVGVTIGSGSRIAATKEELDEAWAWFDMEGPAPELPAGQAALLESVAGDCDDTSQVLGLERVPADSASGPVGEFAVMHVDADCAFIDRFGTASRSPRTLYVIGVPVETAATVVDVVPVSAPVTDPEWRLLAVAPGAGGGGRNAGQADQATLDWAWSTWVGDEEAPEIPDGWTASVASVPGNCSDPSQLRDVRSLGYDWGDDAMKSVGLAALFDPACAEVQDLEASLEQTYSLYVIIVPTDVAVTLHGPWEYITCEENDDVGACQDADRQLVHTKW